MGFGRYAHVLLHEVKMIFICRIIKKRLMGFEIWSETWSEAMVSDLKFLLCKWEASKNERPTSLNTVVARVVWGSKGMRTFFSMNWISCSFVELSKTDLWFLRYEQKHEVKPRWVIFSNVNATFFYFSWWSQKSRGSSKTGDDIEPAGPAITHIWWGGREKFRTSTVRFFVNLKRKEERRREKRGNSDPRRSRVLRAKDHKDPDEARYFLRALEFWLLKPSSIRWWWSVSKELNLYSTVLLL
jgi:hypothetical protein